MLTKDELPKCPVATAVNLIGNKWSLLILHQLVIAEKKRFGELRKNINGISQKVLTQNLQNLENNKLVMRKVYAEVPPRVEYCLTDIGKSLIPLMEMLAQWGEEYKRYTR